MPGFTFVLHTHIPYCRQTGRWPHGEEWIHEAIAETYVPLLVELYDLAEAGVPFKLTLGITPVLAEQLADADIHSHHIGLPVATSELSLDLDSKGDEPAVSRAADRGGQDAGAALLDSPSELTGGLMGLEDADPGKLDVRAVLQHLDGAGSEAAGVPRAALPLLVREPDRAAFASPGS